MTTTEAQAVKVFACACGQLHNPDDVEVIEGGAYRADEPIDESTGLFLDYSIVEPAYHVISCNTIAEGSKVIIDAFECPRCPARYLDEDEAAECCA